MREEPLEGGITNAGQVTRDGTHVLRPATRYTPAIHRLLTFVDHVGFDGAPTPFGIDPDGRERLQFIAGDVPTTPYPEWSQTDNALASIARLVRRFHDCSRKLDQPDLDWPPTLADPQGGDVICHNDLELANIVFHKGVAVALIDFELAAPGRPVHDLAHLIRLCGPIEHEVDRTRMAWGPLDAAARARLVADSYGLDTAGRTELMPALDAALAQIEAVATQQVSDRGADALVAIATTGGIGKYDRRRRWWEANRHRFVAALR